MRSYFINRNELIKVYLCGNFQMQILDLFAIICQVYHAYSNESKMTAKQETVRFCFSLTLIETE